MDHFRNPTRIVVSGIGEHLHIGRIYPPVAGCGGRSVDPAVDLGQTSGALRLGKVRSSESNRITAT